MQFLYFVPSKEHYTPDTLAYAFEGKPGIREISAKGPSGGSGQLLFDPSWHTHLSKTRHEPERQKWRKIPGTGLWVGMYIEHKPAPSELIRKQPLEGHGVELADDQTWTVPICRQFNVDAEQFHISLPCKMELDDDGNWGRGDVVERYQHLADVADRWFEFFMAQAGGQATETVTIDDTAHWCVTVLQANYRIGAAELDLLGALTDETRQEVLGATIDVPTVRDWVKKKQRDEPLNSTLGCEVETPVTIPA